MGLSNKELPKLGFLYMDYVLRFFDHSNFKGWPNKIETVTYHWKNDKERFIQEVKDKKIDVLIGNVPATAYETFREIARALPNVRFIPSLDTQFSNKSKENVTRFAWKYDLPIPKTYIYYNHKNADKFLKKCEYPKIIKKSYSVEKFTPYRYLVGATVLFQQAAFFRKRAFEVAGGFNKQNRTCWDGELWLDMVKKGVKMKHVPEFWGTFRVYDGTITGGGDARWLKQYLKERARMFQATYGRDQGVGDRLANLVFRVHNKLVVLRR